MNASSQHDRVEKCIDIWIRKRLKPCRPAPHIGSSMQKKKKYDASYVESGQKWEGAQKGALLAGWRGFKGFGKRECWIRIQDRVVWDL